MSALECVLKNSSVEQILLSRKAMLKEGLMFVCGFGIKVSFQSAVEEQYFHIEERFFVVGN